MTALVAVETSLVARGDMDFDFSSPLTRIQDGIGVWASDAHHLDLLRIGEGGWDEKHQSNNYASSNALESDFSFDFTSVLGRLNETLAQCKDSGALAAPDLRNGNGELSNDGRPPSIFFCTASSLGGHASFGNIVDQESLAIGLGDAMVTNYDVGSYQLMNDMRFLACNQTAGLERISQNVSDPIEEAHEFELGTSNLSKSDVIGALLIQPLPNEQSVGLLTTGLRASVVSPLQTAVRESSITKSTPSDGNGRESNGKKHRRSRSVSREDGNLDGNRDQESREEDGSRNQGVVPGGRGRGDDEDEDKSRDRKRDSKPQKRKDNKKGRRRKRSRSSSSRRRDESASPSDVSRSPSPSASKKTKSMLVDEVIAQIEKEKGYKTAERFRLELQEDDKDRDRIGSSVKVKDKDRDKDKDVQSDRLKAPKDKIKSVEELLKEIEEDKRNRDTNRNRDRSASRNGKKRNRRQQADSERDGKRRKVENEESKSSSRKQNKDGEDGNFNDASNGPFQKEDLPPPPPPPPRNTFSPALAERAASPPAPKRKIDFKEYRNRQRKTPAPGSPSSSTAASAEPSEPILAPIKDDLMDEDEDTETKNAMNGKELASFHKKRADEAVFKVLEEEGRELSNADYVGAGIDYITAAQHLLKFRTGVSHDEVAGYLEKARSLMVKSQEKGGQLGPPLKMLCVVMLTTLLFHKAKTLMNGNKLSSDLGKLADSADRIESDESAKVIGRSKDVFLVFEKAYRLIDEIMKDKSTPVYRETESLLNGLPRFYRLLRHPEYHQGWTSATVSLLDVLQEIKAHHEN